MYHFSLVSMHSNPCHSNQMSTWLLSVPSIPSLHTAPGFPHLSDSICFIRKTKIGLVALTLPLASPRFGTLEFASSEKSPCSFVYAWDTIIF